MKTQDTKATKATKQVQALDNMEKQVVKAEKAAKAEANKAKRLENATKRLETLKQGAKENTLGFANITLKRTHQERALNISVQGAIDSLNNLIKEIAKAANLEKKVIAALKGEAAKTLLQQVTETTLPIYIDNKGNYKAESLYRLVASKAKNSDLRALLNNLKKAEK
jgi:S-adenosylmethionine:tRNA-ribosyltransferase-isomerase (queuine synthetase)